MNPSLYLVYDYLNKKQNLAKVVQSIQKALHTLSAILKQPQQRCSWQGVAGGVESECPCHRQVGTIRIVNFGYISHQCVLSKYL